METKLVLKNRAPEKDETLVRKFAKAHVWFERIRNGETFAKITTMQDTSKRRIQQMIGLAFLAPDIVREALDGQQPPGLTSEWLFCHDLLSNWTELRAIIATL